MISIKKLFFSWLSGVLWGLFFHFNPNYIILQMFLLVVAKGLALHLYMKYPFAEVLLKGESPFNPHLEPQNFYEKLTLLVYDNFGYAALILVGILFGYALSLL